MDKLVVLAALVLSVFVVSAFSATVATKYMELEELKVRTEVKMERSECDARLREEFD